MGKKKILNILGSTRQNSSNHHLLKAIENLYAEVFDFVYFNGIDSLPHFNPDLDANHIAEINNFKQLIHMADGVLICTPEYAHGIPGSLKNAIDWTVATGEFSQKPTALITAATEGENSHQSLLETLRVLEAKDIEKNHLLIPFIRTKVNSNHEITDETTEIEVAKLMDSLLHTIPH